MKKVLLIQWLNTFIESLTSEKGYSTNTYRAYRRDLFDFAEFLSANFFSSKDAKAAAASIDVRKINPLMLRGYLGFLHRRNKKTTIARKLSSVRSFFSYLVKHNVISENPTDNVLTPKHKRGIPTYLTVDDMFRLLDSIKGDRLLTRRNRAMFETLYSSGLRVSELAGLDLFDIDFDRGVVKVTGKGRKERIVPIGKRALNAIQAYRRQLEHEKGLSQDQNSPLFLNKNNGRLTPRSIAACFNSSRVATLRFFIIPVISPGLIPPKFNLDNGRFLGPPIRKLNILAMNPRPTGLLPFLFLMVFNE